MISAYWWFPWTSVVPSTLKGVGHDAVKNLPLPLAGVLCVLSALRVPSSTGPLLACCPMT